MKPIIPLEPISAKEFPQGDQWVSQVKWDGTRILTYCEGSQSHLYNRKQNERTMQYPELTNVRSFCSARSVILDGEVIALVEGKPSFHEIMKRDKLTKLQNMKRIIEQIPIVYMIFDVLYYNGEWITEKKLAYRQSILEDIIVPNEHIQRVTNHNNAEQLFEVVKQHHLEGIVCKDMNSTYRMDTKDKRWQKIKWYKDLNAVIGGVTYRGNVVNSLLLGLYDLTGRLWYIGHAGTGKLKQEDWRNLTNQINKMIVEIKPFCNLPERWKDAMWIKPELTVKVNFLEWTVNGTLRQPSIQALINIPPYDCKFETET